MQVEVGIVSSADIFYQYTNTAGITYATDVSAGANISLQPAVEVRCVICGEQSTSLVCDQDREVFTLFKRWYLEQKARDLVRELDDQDG